MKMAFIFAGLGLAAGFYYLVNEGGKIISDTVKPLNDYISKENKDSEERISEDLRQKQHDRVKESHKKNDQIRGQYRCKERACFKLHNDLEVECCVIYVNHHLAKSENEARIWSRKVIEVDYFAGDYLNRSNTKHIKLKVNEKIEILPEEFNDYYLVLLCAEHYYILHQDKTKISEIIMPKPRDDSVDIECKWY